MVTKLEKAKANLDWTLWPSVLVLAEEVAAAGRWSPDVEEIFLSQVSMTEDITEKLLQEFSAAVARGQKRAAA